MPGLGTSTPLSSPTPTPTTANVSGYVWSYKKAATNTAYYEYVPAANLSSAETAASYISSQENVTVGIVGNTSVAYVQQTNYSNYDSSTLSGSGWVEAGSDFYGSSTIIAPNGQVLIGPNASGSIGVIPALIACISCRI